jgi:GNAT superfamily N-acetyltransferase
VSAKLRDGSRVDVRPVRPDDRELLREGFARLSPESRYRRFLVPVNRLSDEWLTYLTEVDHHDHEAIAALDPKTGRGVGVARFVRAKERPDAAEAAVTVADEWQGRGLGTLLLELLAARARDEGIRVFTALVLAGNDDMLDLLRRLGPTRVVDRELGTVEIEAELPAEGGLSPQMRELLRLARGGEAPAPRRGSARRAAADGAHVQSSAAPPSSRRVRRPPAARRT